jgi:signal transduction histidine kinase
VRKANNGADEHEKHDELQVHVGLESLLLGGRGIRSREAQFSEDRPASAASRDMDRVKRTVETDRLRSALLTSISHDLKTPLAAVLGSASTLRDLAGKLLDHTLKYLAKDAAVAEALIACTRERALPPLRPPLRPKATAAGSFPLFLWRRRAVLDLPPRRD